MRCASSRVERLEVRAEEARAGHVLLGLPVEAGVDRVVGPLEEAELAVLGELEARVAVVLSGEADEPARRHDHRGGDVVLHLHLVGRHEVLAELVGAPGAVLLAARRAGSCRPACGPSYLSSCPGAPLMMSTLKWLAPVVAPLRPVEALDDEDQRADVVRDALEPGVVLGRVFAGIGREQLDHRAERPLGREKRPGGPRPSAARARAASGRRSRGRRSPATSSMSSSKSST